MGAQDRLTRPGRTAVATAVVGLVLLAGCADREQAGSSRTTGAAAGNSAATTTTAATGTPTTTAPTTTALTTTAAAGATTATVTAGTGPVAATTTTRPPAAGDFSVTYPAGWGPAGQVQATAFAVGATCGSALIVDRAIPEGSGPGAQVEQSYVQVCWKGTEGRTLAEFMTTTYGAVGGFQPAMVAGRPAFVSRSGDASTYFVDTAARRYQIVTAVTATPALRAARVGEVQQVVGSLTLPP